MGISLTHPQRQSRQYAYSDRDIAYLEKNGWVREKPPEQVAVLVRQIEDDILAGAGSTNTAFAAVIKSKGGRPRKVK